MQRFSHFKQVVFELNQQIVEAGNQQKAIQIYLNQLANTLRQEEREKLRISDINYKPQPVKIEKPKPVKVTAKKLDKAELRKYAAELQVSEFMLQQIVIAKGVTVADAAKLLRQSINRAKAGL
jgi:DNA integrity scanning protein DisA with diadenylate cyclase activity